MVTQKSTSSPVCALKLKDAATYLGDLTNRERECYAGMNKELNEAHCATVSVGLPPGGRKLPLVQ